MNRIVRLETEYGCLTSDNVGPTDIVGFIRNWIFDNHRYGLADWNGPAGNGGFLFNGGRVSVDVDKGGHLKYCTPECLALADLIRYDRAGDSILLCAVRELGLAEAETWIRQFGSHGL
jgi:proteasome accessory factor A